MLLVSKIYAQTKKIPEDFGFRHLQFKFQNDPVDVIVISKQYEEKCQKPMLLYCQENGAQPIVKYDENGLYEILPFSESAFLATFHIVIIAKPYIPVIANVKQLGENFVYNQDNEKTKPPKNYTDRNYLDYYVFRNNFILKQLLKERWTSKNQIVLIGQHEGSSVAAKMASLNAKVTHLIYSDGNPYGQISSEIVTSRTRGFSTTKSFNLIDHWKVVVANAAKTNADGGESYKMVYDFSLPQRDNLLQLNIPVLMVYDTENSAVVFNDLFQMEAIREGKENFTFLTYGPCDCDDYYRKKVAVSWQEWLTLHNA